MKKRSWLLAPFALILSTSALAHTLLPPGIWTNTEDEYFAEEESRETPEWVSFEVDGQGNWRNIDAFGKPIGEWSADSIDGLQYDQSAGWSVNGSELRKAEAFSCWAMLLKNKPKADGGEDWVVHRELRLHDQGGRVLVPGNGEADDAVLRVRNVTWAKGSSSLPSLVLYVHKEDPVRAESYAWTAPSSGRIGVNLRWMQARCSRASNGPNPEPRR